MAELYFKVHSDWEEVVKLRTEIMRLESQLNQFNGKAPLDVLDKMCNELVTAKTRLQSLVDDAAIAGAKMEEAFKKGTVIDLSTPEGHIKANGGHRNDADIRHTTPSIVHSIKKRGCRRFATSLFDRITSIWYHYSLIPEPFGSLVISKRTSFSMTAGWL